MKLLKMICMIMTPMIILKQKKMRSTKLMETVGPDGWSPAPIAGPPDPRGPFDFDDESDEPDAVLIT
jgi:hypothetical protein